jgi:hypothetical protein
MTMRMPNWLKIGTPSAWADTFRPSLGTQDRFPLMTSDEEELTIDE